ncbi:hypothetical protein QQF64_025251 [Cirrhinus molitorella]|uniref:Uncharacterized protein n=1 Tax=Cirrhinus molitorella TaxID=172907 RepID=A0ABR3NNJ0_9TELE
MLSSPPAEIFREVWDYFHKENLNPLTSCLMMRSLVSEGVSVKCLSLNNNPAKAREERGLVYSETLGKEMEGRGGGGGVTELGSTGGSGGDGEDCIVQALDPQPELSVISHYGGGNFQ